jgi:hypothetical protein
VLFRSGSKSKKTNEEEIPIRLEALDGTYTTDRLIAITSNVVTTSVNPIPVCPSNFSHLRKLKFTEKYPALSGRTVDIMCDAGTFVDLLSSKKGVIRGKTHEPCAILTKLGPVLCGSYKNEEYMDSQNKGESPKTRAKKGHFASKNENCPKKADTPPAVSWEPQMTAASLSWPCHISKQRLPKSYATALTYPKYL